MNGTAPDKILQVFSKEDAFAAYGLDEHVCSARALAMVAILTSSIMSIWQSLRGSATQSKA